MRIATKILAGVVLLSVSAQLVRADDTNTLQIIQQLKQRIDELEKKVQTLEHAPQIPTNSTPLVATQTKTPSNSPDARPKNVPTISLGDRSFSFASADSNYVLRLGAVLQVD